MRSPLAPVRGWPEEARRRYRDLGLWNDETFADFVANRTERFADREALVGVDARGHGHRWTYAELRAAADAAAALLVDAGVEPGDRVVVALPNVVEYAAVVLGLFRMGALPVFALPTHREAELGQFCEIADAAALVLCGTDVDATDLHARVAERLTVAPPALVDVATWDLVAAPEPTRARLGAEDVAFLQLSGGTTGVAKLIPRTAADYLHSVRESARICELDRGSTLLVVLPVSHNFPMSSPGILGVWHAGGRVVLARDPSPRTAFGLVERERVDLVSLVPPLAQAWISAARRRRPDLSSLRTIQVGGARLSDVVAREVEQVLHGRVQQVFGMAEGLVNYTRPADHAGADPLALRTQGRPISDWDEVRVVDAADRDLPDGEEGHLLTRGPYTIRGYYRSPAADRESFTSDGFYRTGDLVRRLPTGHLVVTGRAKDQINRAGEKIAPDELEGPLLTHPDVIDAVAVGLPDPVLGERVCVVVRADPSRPRPDLADHLRRAGLATHKQPDEFRFLDVLPQTHVDKNSRRDLRRLLAQQLTA